MLRLVCKICFKDFLVKPYRIEAKYCSRKCYGLSERGKIPKSAFEKGYHPPNEFKPGKNHPYYGLSSPALGKHWVLGENTRKKMSLARKGKPNPKIKDDKHHAWKGDDVGYRGLHYWIQRNLGKPETCKHCGVKGLHGRKIHWANISQKYKRDIKDWIRLCVSCHKKFDSPRS